MNRPALAPPRPVTPVGILSTMLEQVRDRVESQPGADPLLVAQLQQATELASGLDPYLGECTTPESPALRELARRTHEEDWGRRSGDSRTPLEQEMLSGHVEGQLLQMLVHATRARRVLDIGMFTGYSALAMAEALPADGQVVACEVDPFVAGFAEDCFASSESGGRIRVRLGPAIRTLEELAEAGESFDLIFIDADKARYGDYLALVLDTDLLAPHGLVCVDNTLMQGQAYGAGDPTTNGVAIATFNQALAADPRVAQVLVPLRDGLTLIRRVAGA